MMELLAAIRGRSPRTFSGSRLHTCKRKNEKISKKGVARGRKPSRHALVVRQLANSLAKRVYFYVFGIGIKLGYCKGKACIFFKVSMKEGFNPSSGEPPLRLTTRIEHEGDESGRDFCNYCAAG